MFAEAFKVLETPVQVKLRLSNFCFRSHLFLEFN